MIATVTLNPSLDEWIELPAFRQGRLNRATGFVRYPGGKGINVSRVIHTLGGTTKAFALAGGEDGEILRALMDRLDLPYEFVPVAGSTRNNYKIITRSPRTLTEINASGPSVRPAKVARLKRRVVGLRPRPRCVVLSGSLPPHTPASTYRDWIVALKRRRIPAVLDSSGAALREGIGAAPWLIKPNRHEAEELIRRPLARLRDQVEAVRRFLERGPSLVALSLGGEGALLGSADPAGIWLARAPAVKVDSIVGAGDSFVGGFVSGWDKGRSLVEAFRLGVACGSAAAMTPGTELCRRSDVRRLLPRVRLSRID